MLRHHRDIGTKVSGSRNNKLQPPGEGNAGHPVASPGAPKTPSSRLPHACCHGVDVVADGKKERNSARSRTRDAMQHHPVASPSNGGQQYRSGTRANQRSKIDTYICRNVESIDSSGCSEHLQGDSGWNARRVPLSTEISWDEQTALVATGDSMVYRYHCGVIRIFSTTLIQDKWILEGESARPDVRLWASSSSGLQDYAIRCFGLHQMDISYTSKICINLSVRDEMGYRYYYYIFFSEYLI